MPFVNALSTKFGFPKKITKLISYEHVFYIFLRTSIVKKRSIRSLKISFNPKRKIPRG
jgi:hypothetical protein